MTIGSSTPRILAIGLVLLGSFLSPSCGGDDDGGGTIPPGLTATFTPASASPPPLSVTMQPGTSNQDVFRIRIAVKNVNNFFGAAFHVTFNANTAAFVSMDSAGSFLLAAGVETFFQATSVGAGEIAVTATRLQDDLGSVQGVDVTNGDLAVLTFRATRATVSTPNFFNFAQVRKVCESDVTVPQCPTIDVQWSGGSMTAN